MPRPCTICTHPERAAIDKALVAGEVISRIIAEYRETSADALWRHKRDHIPATLAEAERRQQDAHGDNLLLQTTEQANEVNQYGIDLRRELQRCFARVNLLFDACDAWLRDPSDLSRYDLGPRSEDIQVIYDELDSDGRSTRAKASLADLLARLRGAGLAVQLVETKHADPRELLLKTANRLQGQLELVAKLAGELDERPVVNLALSPEWLAVRGVILGALVAFPDARLAVADRLAAVEDGHARD